MWPAGATFTRPVGRSRPLPTVAPTRPGVALDEDRAPVRDALGRAPSPASRSRSPARSAPAAFATRQPSPTRPCRPDQPGRDPVRRAIWPPDSLRPAFTRPSWPGQRAISRPHGSLRPAQRLSGTPLAPIGAPVRALSTYDRPSWPVVPPSNLAQSRPAARRRPAMQPVSRLRRLLRDPRPCPAPPAQFAAGDPVLSPVVGVPTPRGPPRSVPGVS